MTKMERFVAMKNAGYGIREIARFLNLSMLTVLCYLVRIKMAGR